MDMRENKWLKKTDRYENCGKMCLIAIQMWENSE